MKLFSLSAQDKIHARNIFYLLIICLLCYWPLSFGVFSVKNDAIHYFLPYRFAVSEAIRNGEWPFWSPYIYLGNPIYGDMQSGAWNPVVWLFSLAGRYNITSLHAETLLYIFLAGTGMYKLVFGQLRHEKTALLCATAYMLSGFLLDGQLINWLASAAFIPYVIHYYLQLLSACHWKTAWKAGFFLYLLFVCGYPSFFILTIYLLLVLFVINLSDRFRKKIDLPERSWKKFLSAHLLLAVTFTCLSIPAIISYLDLLPYYTRGSGITYAESIINPFGWQHLLTFLFPAATGAQDMVTATDLTCRNVYAGIFTLFVLFAMTPALKRRNILLWTMIIFSFLFSLGDATPIRKLCYDLIPFMNSFRHPSQMRLFILLGMILLAAPGLKNFLTETIPSKNFSKPVFIAWVLGGVILICMVLSIIQSGTLQSVMHWDGNFVSRLKEKLSNLSLNDTVAISALAQIFFMALFLWWMRKKTLTVRKFSWLWILNMFLMAQLVLPMTFVSKTAPATINRVIRASPQGFPVTGFNNTLEQNSADAMNNYAVSGLGYFYNKKIGISHVTYSPSFLLEQEPVYKNDALYDLIASEPVAYIADTLIQSKDAEVSRELKSCHPALGDSLPPVYGGCTNKSSATIIKLSSKRFSIRAATDSAAYLVLTQSYHHHWNVNVDGQPGKISLVSSGFMAVYLSPGQHQVDFSFVPANTIRMIWIMVGFLIISLLAFMFIRPGMIKQQPA